MELGYWNYRALIGPCKLLLEYVGADWNDVQYERIKKSDGNLDWAQWNEVKNSEKFQKNFAFPNLPYLIDGNVHLTQSLAILKVRIPNSCDNFSGNIFFRIRTFKMATDCVKYTFPSIK